MMNPLLIQIDIGGVWRLSIFAGMVLCTFSIMRTFAVHMGNLVTAFWSYALVSALIVFEFPGLRWGDLQTAFSASAGQSFAEILLIPLAVAMIPGKDLPKWWQAMTYFIAAENILMWWKGCGIMLAPSLDTALIACFAPFAPLWLLAASILTIATHHGTTAILILLAQLAAFVIRDFREKHSLPISSLLAVPVAVCIAMSHNHDALLNGGERLHAWQKYMTSWWLDGWNTRLFGCGPGSFPWLSMMIDNYKPPHFLQMHNDWLQITFELGFVGLAFTIAVVTKAIKQSWDNPRLLSAIFGCAAFSLTYHPLRFFPSMLLVALIFREALTDKRN